MIEIFINLKRFDVPKSLGGICPVERPRQWIEQVLMSCVHLGLGKLPNLSLVFLLPEALVLPALEKLTSYPVTEWSHIGLGSQGVFREDVKAGGNFGAFTTNRPAAAVRALGCTWSIIGHSEERKDKLGIITAYDQEVTTQADKRRRMGEAVNQLINQEVLCALDAGLNVLYCIGETAEEKGEGSFEEQKPRIESVLRAQIEMGLRSVPEKIKERRVVIGYEPVWAIGPGKTPPGADYIGYVASTIREICRTQLKLEPAVVYGGGLKAENAATIAGIPSIGGGLVGLTKFTGDIAFEAEGLKEIVDKYLGVVQ